MAQVCIAVSMLMWLPLYLLNQCRNNYNESDDNNDDDADYDVMDISMSQRKTAVTPLLTHWGDYNHRYISIPLNLLFSAMIMSALLLLMDGNDHGDDGDAHTTIALAIVWNMRRTVIIMMTNLLSSLLTLTTMKIMTMVLKLHLHPKSADLGRVKANAVGHPQIALARKA